MPPAIHRKPKRDGGKPRPYIADTTSAVPVHTQKNLLRHVLGVVRIAKHAVGDLEDEASILPNDDFQVPGIVFGFGQCARLLRRNFEDG